MPTLLILASFALVSLLLHAVAVYAGARLLVRPKVTFVRALGAAALIYPVGVLLALAALAANGGPPVLPPLLGLLTLFLPWIVLRWALKTTFIRAAGVWAVMLLGVAASLAAAFLVVVPYAVEGFINPSSPNAPALVGWHFAGKCPHCDGALLLSALPPSERRGPETFFGPRRGVCDRCGEVSEAQEAGPEILPPDRFLANKTLTPRRWDLIVFRSPRQPDQKYVMRLVGLPGEVVFLRDGAVWAGGVRLTPPDELAHVRYTPDAPGPPNEFGTPEEPWRLRADECLVLGDFPPESVDSRCWGPLPWANVEGVAGVRWWPLPRWKSWR